MTDLSLLSFGNNDDKLLFEDEGLFVPLAGKVNTLNGDDTIIVANAPSIALLNEGSIDTGEGDDRLSATSDLSGIQNLGSLNTGTGNDLVQARGENGFGVTNTGFLILGEGTDRLLAEGAASGLINESVIDAGPGDDTIRANSSTQNGIDNRSVLFLASGNDLINAQSNGDDGIKNQGLLDCGTGDDTVRGSSIGDSGIENLGGNIFLARGNDTIIGKGGKYGLSNLNSGVMGPGPGDDLLKGEGQTSGIFNQGLINADEGSDQVIGIGGTLGIQNDSSIQTSEGDDLIAGSGDSQGILISETGRIITGSENDTIIGEGDDMEGIRNNGIVFTDIGDDRLIGVSDNGFGIYNTNFMNFGGGSDQFTGFSTDGTSAGIVNDSGSVVMGRNDDVLSGRSHGGNGLENINNGIINTGSGIDEVLGVGSLAGIFNQGTIETGADNDVLTGQSTGAGFALLNSGLISTGDGTDIVDGLDGGFSGGGKIELGRDSDTLIGFGDIEINGSLGIDQLLLPAGSYLFNGRVLTSMDGSGEMIVESFELVGGASSGATVLLESGSFSIDNNGTISYI